MNSQNIYLSSWDILYKKFFEVCDQMKGNICFRFCLFLRIEEEYEDLKDSDHEENLSVGERIILKWI
jgi:hypothetical protein